MDPRERADALLARAAARGRNVVTPDNAISPMDGATSRIPRSVITAAEPFDDPDTQSIPAPGMALHEDAVTQPVFAEDTVTQPMITDDARQQGLRRRPAATPVPSPLTLENGIEEEPPTRALDGLVPTVQPQVPQRRSVTDRLSGLD